MQPRTHHLQEKQFPHQHPSLLEILTANCKQLSLSYLSHFFDVGRAGCGHMRRGAFLPCKSRDGSKKKRRLSKKKKKFSTVVVSFSSEKQPACVKDDGLSETSEEGIRGVVYESAHGYSVRPGDNRRQHRHVNF